MSFWASDFWAEGFWAEGFWASLGATTAGTPDLIAIQIPLTMVKEETGFTAKVYFRNRATSTDETPTTARYRIDCKTTGKTVQDWTDLSATSTITIAVTPTNNRIVSTAITAYGEGQRFERKQMIVESNTDTDTAYSGSVTWTVKNVHGVN